MHSFTVLGKQSQITLALYCELSRKWHCVEFVLKENKLIPSNHTAVGNCNIIDPVARDAL